MIILGLFKKDDRPICIKNFWREASATQELLAWRHIPKHPSIIAYYGAITEPNFLCLVLELGMYVF